METFKEQFEAGILNIIKTNNDLGPGRFVSLFAFTKTKRHKTIYLGLISSSGQVYRTHKTYNNLETALHYVSKGQWSYVSYDKRAKKNNTTTLPV